MRFWRAMGLLLGAACGSNSEPIAPAAGTGAVAAGSGATGMTANPMTQAGVGAAGASAPRDAGTAGAGAAPPDAARPIADAASEDDAGAASSAPDAGVAADSGSPPVENGTPGTFKVFDRIPQFGMYRTDEPQFTPPPGVLMWSRGTLFVAKLSRDQQRQIGADLKARVTYHAQCDNYDRIGGVFFILMPPGQAPTEESPRVELIRFITPFSNYMRGMLATYTFPAADVATYASTFADPAHDVWIGIGGGSNPYDGDPCTNTNQPASFKEIGYLYSLELASSEPLVVAPSTTLSALSNQQLMRVPVDATFVVDGAALSGRVTVIVSGHGAEAGGNEYMNTKDRVLLNGTEIGSFATAVDCATYARFSPDGNQGIFRNNKSNNPRNWCPGAHVEPHTFEATLMPGPNTVRLEIDPARVPAGSYYATSISFSSP